MKTNSALLLVAASALCLSSVDAHGKMTSPRVRQTNAKYNKDAHFSLRNAGNGETQIAPVELLNQRGQADNPAAATFDIMNGCRGIEYDSSEPVTNVTPGQSLPVTWEINAPHPGYMEIYIVRPTTESSGKVMYKQDGPALKRIDDFAKAGGTGSTTVTIPSTLKGCGTPGNCALQFYWYSSIAKQTYVNCADIVAAGTGNAAPSSPASAPSSPASAPASRTPARAPSPATPARSPAAPAVDRPAADANTSRKSACRKRLRK